MAYHTTSSFGFVDLHPISDGCRQVICAAQAGKRGILTVWPRSASQKDINAALQPGSTNVDISLSEGLAASPSIRSSTWKF